MTTTEQKAFAYDMALEKAKEMMDNTCSSEQTKCICQELFPELKESEDERIRKFLTKIVDNLYPKDFDTVKKLDVLAWLEKQKENPKSADSIPSDCVSDAKCEDRDQKHSISVDEIAKDYVNGVKDYNSEPTWDLIHTAVCYGYHYREQKEPTEELVYRLNGLMQEYIEESVDEAEKEHRFKCYQLFWDALEDEEFFKKEQKPVDYDHEMWKNCEANFEGGKKEVIDNPEKYGLCKPAEWSEEDKNGMFTDIVMAIRAFYKGKREDLVDYFKSLRPSWKPSKEQIYVYGQ